MRSKRFTLLPGSLAIVLLAATLAACSAPAAPPPATQGAQPTVAVQPTAAAPATAGTGAAQAVQMWTYYGDTGPAAGCVKAAADDFNAAQKAYQLNIRNIPFSQFNQEVTTAIAAGATPDLMIVDNPDNARYASVGALADLSDKVKAWGQGDQFLPGPWNSTIFQGKNYGIPLGSNTVVLWINTDLAKAASLDVTNPPKTWDEFETWAGKMTDKSKGVYGTALLAKRDETGTFLFLPWILQNGGSIDKLDSPEAIAALAFWRKLVDEGYAPKSAINDGFAEIYQQFTTGKAAMMISGTWNVNSIPKDAPNLHWMVATLPYTKQPASSLGGENWAMFAASKQQDGAWAFLKFVVDPSYGTKLTDCMGYIPSRKDVLAQVAAKNKDNPTMQVFLKQMESAAARGPLANWSDASEVVQVAMQEALSGQKTPDKAMQDAAVKMKAVLAGQPLPTEAPAPTAGPAQAVQMWTYYGDTGPAAGCVKAAADDFNAAQKAYQLNIRNIPFSQFNQEVTTAIAAGATPDLMIVDNPDNARYASVGALADLSDKVKAWGQGDQFLPGPWNSTIFQGKNYGIPLGSNTVVLWINTDLAKAASLDVTNPPKTWDEFETWAGKMTDKSKGVYGTALLAKRDEAGTFLFLPWILQNGGSIDKLDSPEAIAALAFWRKLVDEGYAPKSAINDGFAEIYQQFTTGKAAMMISGTWNVNSIPKDAPNLHWMVATLPYTKQPASSLGGENWAMFAASKQQDGAWAFLKFVVDPSYGTKLTDCMGYIPSRKDVLAQVAAKNKDNPTMQVFLKQMESAAARGPLANWSDASEVVQVAMQEALSGQKTPDKAMQDAAVKMKAVLGK